MMCKEALLTCHGHGNAVKVDEHIVRMGFLQRMDLNPLTSYNDINVIDWDSLGQELVL